MCEAALLPDDAAREGLVQAWRMPLQRCMPQTLRLLCPTGLQKHRDSEKCPGMFGTLTVCLPSQHEVRLVTFHGARPACHAVPQPCHAMPCPAMPCHPVPCPSMLCSAMPCHAMLLHAMPCHLLHASRPLACCPALHCAGRGAGGVPWRARVRAGAAAPHQRHLVRRLLRRQGGCESAACPSAT